MHQLSPVARLYLLHVALITFALALSSLFLNLMLLDLGYDQRTLALPLLGEISLLGVFNSLPVLTASLSSLPLWGLLLRVGLQRSMLIACGLLVASLLTLACNTDPLPLLVGAGLSGPASVLFQLSAAPLMMRLSGDGARDTLFSMRFGLSIAMSGVGNLVGGWLPGLGVALWRVTPQSAASYQFTFAISALLVLVASLPLLRVRVAASPPQPSGTPQASSMGHLWRICMRRPWAIGRLLIAPLLISCGASLLIPYLSLYVRQRYATPDTTLGLVFAAIGISTGLAALLAPQISARLGKPRSVVLTQGLAVVCLLLLAWAPSLWIAAFMALLRGALMNMANPLYEAYAMEQSADEARPVVSGLLAGSYSAAYIIGPTISAEVQRQFGFTPIFIATAICYGLAVGWVYMVFVRRGRV
ncbi:MFS transporter [Candidatus Oscillochloris fontis]|uniref:MFS transporter n=1 Tax=Candidatus Oscillochloris fontis TaxID=2496868 RepID=UPI00101BA6FE|nr:MFS transporter [Candidatus Oscillochloris fontis]